MVVSFLFFVSILSTQARSVELPKKPANNSYAPSSKTAYPNTTLIKVDHENSIYIAGTYSLVTPTHL